MRRRTFLFGASASTLVAALRARAGETSLGTIAFVQAGDLWFRGMPDGQPQKLTTGARVQSPRFSPSGEWIAYHNGDALHVIRRDGSTARQLPSGAATWLPAGDVLAVANNEGLRLFRPTNGWNAPELLNKEAGIPVFSPNGTQLVYSNAIEKGRGPGGEPMRDGQLCHFVLTGAEREPQVLVSKYLTCLLPYAWTRDGKSVLYWEDPDCSASVMADGLELFRVTAAGGSAQSLGVTVLVHDDVLALSPTQNKLAVTAGRGRETWSAKRIAIIDLDTGALRYLTDENTSAICPSWSPDGKQIAYVAAPDAVLEHMKQMGNPASVRVMGLDGTPRTVPVTPKTRIGVPGAQAKPYLEQRRIWVADASNAASPKQITQDDRYRDEEPMWSIGGTHILFCRMDRDGSGTLWLMSAGGENPIQVSGPLLLEQGWPGYYGYIDWRRTFDWFRASV